MVVAGFSLAYARLCSLLRLILNYPCVRIFRDFISKHFRHTELTLAFVVASFHSIRVVSNLSNKQPFIESGPIQCSELAASANTSWLQQQRKINWQMQRERKKGKAQRESSKLTKLEKWKNISYQGLGYGLVCRLCESDRPAKKWPSFGLVPGITHGGPSRRPKTNDANCLFPTHT